MWPRKLSLVCFQNLAYSWRETQVLVWLSHKWIYLQCRRCRRHSRRHLGSIPGSGRSPGEGHGNPLWYSCLGNPMGRGARWATVHGVSESWLWLKRLSTSPHSWREAGCSSRMAPSRKLPWSFHFPSGCLDIIPFTERLSSSCLVNSPLAQETIQRNAH